jgi:hypothetical protein
MHTYIHTHTHTYIHAHTQRFDMDGSRLCSILTPEERNSDGVVYKNGDVLSFHTKFKVGLTRKDAFEAQVRVCMYACMHVCM